MLYVRVCAKFKLAEKTLIPVIAFNIYHSLALLELLYTCAAIVHMMAFLYIRQTTKANMLHITTNRVMRESEEKSNNMKNFNTFGDDDDILSN